MKKIYTPYFEILTEMDAQEIFSKADLLRNPVLYAKYWETAQGFAAFCLASKTTTNKNGDILPGNAFRVRRLIEAGIVAQKEDVELDATIKLVERLDKLIFNKCGNHRTVSHQYNCAYMAINHVVVDLSKKLPPDEIRVFSLEDTVKSDKVSPDKACTYQDVIPDDTYSGERILIEKETISELTDILRLKKAKELEEKRQKALTELAETRKKILQEIQIPLLSKHPAEIMTRLAKEHLCVEHEDLTARIMSDGYEHTFNEIIYAVSEKFDIPLVDIQSYVNDCKVPAEHVKKDKGLVRLLSEDPKAVSDQLSKYTNRAKTKVLKYKPTQNK